MQNHINSKLHNHKTTITKKPKFKLKTTMQHKNRNSTTVFQIVIQQRDCD